MLIQDSPVPFTLRGNDRSTLLCIFTPFLPAGYMVIVHIYRQLELQISEVAGCSIETGGPQCISPSQQQWGPSDRTWFISDSGFWRQFATIFCKLQEIRGEKYIKQNLRGSLMAHLMTNVCYLLQFFFVR